MDSRPEETANSAKKGPEGAAVPWFRRLSRPILFLIVSLALVGAYLAFTIPVAVFPNTDFPRIIVGVDNGVMPIDQMLVTVTRPIEEAVNSVPGLNKVVSITSRGSAEVDLFFDWGSDMILTLQRVDAVVARLQPELPTTAKIETHRMTFASFPILGYSLTSDTIPQSKLWEIATYDLKPRINRLDGVASVLVQGGRVPEFQVTPDPARLLAAGITVTRHFGSNSADKPDRFAGTAGARTSTGAGTDQRTSAHSGRNRADCREDVEGRSAGSFG